MVGIELDNDNRVSRCGIGLLGLGSTPKRATAAEAAVTGTPIGTVTAEHIGELAMSTLTDIRSDLPGSASYRARAGAAMVARAWKQASVEALNA